MKNVIIKQKKHWLHIVKFSQLVNKPITMPLNIIQFKMRNH